MGFTYKGNRHLFRWIEPGTFLMGSPSNEPERAEDETQHQVTLSRGFWMADAPVTQALWQEVMGDNPSHFQGDNRPVENVSWDDAQAFIAKMNGMKPELKLCLPTEAQWEYACRAGTTTPFSFGYEISSEQVNFDGNYPYNNGKPSRYREETSDVKTLPPNAWGLYEMHGNIWECCQDWYGEYPSGPVTDPQGPDTGTARVIRGGSWDNFVGNVGSAVRFRFTPAYRYNRLGFRISRGH
ncbi:MAG: formylglycine-generating enzyme family protein [Methylococcaceae bacterium]